MNHRFMGLFLTALQLTSCSDNTASRAIPSYDTAATLDAFLSLPETERLASVAAVGKLTIAQYYDLMLEATTDAPIAVNDTVVTGVRSDWIANRERFLALAKPYPTIGAFWTAMRIDPAHPALRSLGLETPSTGSVVRPRFSGEGTHSSADRATIANCSMWHNILGFAGVMSAAYLRSRITNSRNGIGTPPQGTYSSFFQNYTSTLNGTNPNVSYPSGYVPVTVSGYLQNSLCWEYQNVPTAQLPTRTNYLSAQPTYTQFGFGSQMVGVTWPTATQGSCPAQPNSATSSSASSSSVIDYSGIFGCGLP